jgi:ferredoxin
VADASIKVPENVLGAYFVDESCIACGLCLEEAPNNFEMRYDEQYAFVSRQPESEKEQAQCESALNSCPAGAIGKIH